MARRWPAVVVGILIAAIASDVEAQRRRRRAPPSETTGSLVIEASIEGAEVIVDEEHVGVTPLEGPLRLPPGSHTVRVRRPGYTEFTDVVRIRAGQRVDLPVELLALSMVLTVRTDPDEARVFVNGTFRGNTPIELELNEGSHSIRLRHPTHREVTRQIDAVAGQTQAIDVTLEPIPESELRPREPQWFEDPIIWISVGSGAALVAILVVAVAVATSQAGSPLPTYCMQAPRGDCDVNIRVMGW